MGISNFSSRIDENRIFSYYVRENTMANLLYLPLMGIHTAMCFFRDYKILLQIMNLYQPIETTMYQIDANIK